MLACRCASVNDLVQNKFRSIIHPLSHHFLDQSHRRKHQMHVEDLLKVNNKDTRTKSLTTPCLKTTGEKSACANIFLELPLTNFGIILEWIQHHTMDHTLTFIHWLLIHHILLTLTILTQPPEQNSEAAAGHVLKNFANFKGEHLCGVSFLSCKPSGLQRH